MTRRAPLVIAHRGASGYRPEHTRSAYELAIALGADAVEPDVVATRDGVLVVRHENEISGTTDVASRPEFAGRRTTKSFAGHTVDGWFTEDFTWQELSTLRARERVPRIRPGSAEHDGAEPILRLIDVLALVDAESRRLGREVGVVVEIKHDTYFRSRGHDLAALVDETLRASGWRDRGRLVTFESFEQGVLRRLRERGVPGSYVYLIERDGAPVDLLLEQGAAAPTFAQQLTPAGLDGLARWADGISVAKAHVLEPRAAGGAGPGRVVEDAHERGLRVLVWTCRPENAFLLRRFRSGGGKAVWGDYRSEWSIVRDAGVDGVFVDHPDLGGEFFRSGA